MVAKVVTLLPIGNIARTRMPGSGYFWLCLQIFQLGKVEGTNGAAGQDEHCQGAGYSYPAARHESF